MATIRRTIRRHIRSRAARDALAALAIAALGATGAASASATTSAPGRQGGQAAHGHAGTRAATSLDAAALRSLLDSRELWATVDVCNPHDQPGTIGVRGSMPGDGHAKDTMYMRVKVEYFDWTTMRWTPVGTGADSGYIKVGSADVSRQAGRNFQFARTPGKPAFRLRGTVLFQWRRNTTVIATATRPTTSGHKPLAGADPRGYSADTCLMPQ